MATTRTSPRVAKRAFSALLISIVLASAVASQQQFTTITGKVIGDSTKGSPNIQGARVQIIDAKSPEAKRLWKSTTADTAADYEIEHVPEGTYDIVACDDLLTYKPQIQKKVQVRRSTTSVDFTLPLDDEKSPPLTLTVGKSVVVYLKHFKTGCELVMRAKGDGTVLIPHKVDFNLRYSYCLDDAGDVDSRSPFELCRRKQLVGLTKRKVDQMLNTRAVPHADREWIYYKDVKVRIADGKVSEVQVDVEPCQRGTRCEDD